MRGNYNEASLDLDDKQNGNTKRMKGSYKLDMMRDTIILNGDTKRMRGDYNKSRLPTTLVTTRPTWAVRWNIHSRGVNAGLSSETSPVIASTNTQSSKAPPKIYCGLQSYRPTIFRSTQSFVCGLIQFAFIRFL